MERLSQRAPEDLRRQWDVVACLKNLGDVLHEQEDVAEARRCYERAFDIAKKLLENEPANAEWQSGMAGILDAADHAEARSLLEQARSMLVELRTSERVSDPQVHDWQADIEAMLRDFNDLESQES
jgi:tetratricopeptide (TPR) repeat protein